jgi:hypothetical protein
MRRPDYERRVVVTGLGVISPVGNDKATAWANLTEGVSGLREITYFDTTPYEAKAAGEVQDFDAKAWMDPKAARRSETSLHFGVAAAKQALADSGFELSDENRTDVGVVFGSGAGGQQLMIDNYLSLHERGNRTVAPTFIANALVDSCSGMIAIETGAIGHNVCMVSACATGTHNVGEGAEAIRRGDCIAVITGSTEAPLLEVAHAGFSNMRGMGLPREGEPLQTVSRPFDATRDGFVLGEGAASLFLEDLELAKARGAPRGPRYSEVQSRRRRRHDGLAVPTMGMGVHATFGKYHGVVTAPASMTRARGSKIKINKLLTATTKENHRKHESGIRRSAQCEMQVAPALQAPFKSPLDMRLQQGEHQTSPDQHLNVGANDRRVLRIAPTHHRARDHAGVVKIRRTEKHPGDPYQRERNRPTQPG